MTEYNDQNSRPPEAESDHARGWVDLSVRVALDGPAGPFHLDVALSAAKGAFIALVGPSGAGKTTLLRLLAGLAIPHAGRIRVGSSIWCDTAARTMVPVRDRSIGFVFQDYALFPNMTVQGNVEYAIGRRFDPAEVRRLLELVDLQALAGAYPARLSGGQKQRLALIRALARRPGILMLDEPLSALDPAMRRQLQDELKRLHVAFGTTTFMVSHDITEILRLADRVIRLENGRIVLDGDPASALSTDAPENGLLGHHVSGPDESGYCLVSIEGRICRIRYTSAPPHLSPGDLVSIHMDAAVVHRAGPDTTDQAGAILTFTSRGGAR